MFETLCAKGLVLLDLECRSGQIKISQSLKLDQPCIPFLKPTEDCEMFYTLAKIFFETFTSFQSTNIHFPLDLN